MTSTRHKPAALYQLALDQQRSGQLNRAASTYRELLRLRPGMIEAWCNLGGLLSAGGQYEQATVCYTKALDINPLIPQLHYNLGAAQQAMGRVLAAQACYSRAIDLKPDYLEARFNLGLLSLEQGQYRHAEVQFRHALSINQGIAEVHNSLGVCLKHRGHAARAIEHFRQSIRIRPDYFEALNNLAVELCACGNYTEATTLLEQALALSPNEAGTLFNLGITLKARKRYSEAADCFRMVLRQDSGAVHAHLELAHTLQSVCDWRDSEFSPQATATLIEGIISKGQEDDIDPFNALSLPLSGTTLLRVAQRRGGKIRESVQNLDIGPVEFSRTRHERMRIGYLSPKYCNHPGAHLMGGLFRVHDRDRFEVFAYSLGPDDGSRYRRRIEQEAEHFIDLCGSPLEDSVTRIRRDGIDILVDLAGYTTAARPEILALRVAPLQINYLGFPGTLGADFYDYIITDRTVTPLGDQACYAETFAYLPVCYQINDDRERPTGQAPDRAACNLPEGAFVFCCFNNNYKIDQMVFETWCEILTRVPRSVLWLLKGSHEQVENLQREAAQHGLDPVRLVFAEPLEKSLHLARHIHADLFLDTLNYNAHTTGSDALRMGVPMITLPGRTFASRVGISLLAAVGLTDLAVGSLDEYVEMAASLANESQRLRLVRERLSSSLKHTSLLDNPGHASYLERLYEAMWSGYANGLEPRMIQLV